MIQIHMTIGRRSQRWLAVATLAALPLSIPAWAADPAKPDDSKKKDTPREFTVEQSNSRGSVTIRGKRVDYDAVAGNLVVHGRDWDDTPQNADPDAKQPPASTSMFYVAYFADNKGKSPRPITFIYNGGPGSASVWLHMGAFGPKRVITSKDSHTPAAPYTLANNDDSLLDASDLVFIDAPGAGFSRITGKDGDKAFYGVDEDANAFAEFIRAFLSKYSRWNSPKYLFGESYGTTRSATLVNVLQGKFGVDMNGVILLSQILMFDGHPDGPEVNPGVNLPYQLALPTYAASAWYHHKLPGNQPELKALLAEVEQFAMHEYADALQEGGQLPADRKQAIAERLHQYTGLSTDYIVKADLRISGGVFEKALQDDAGLTTGRIDTRFSGTHIDPLDKSAAYDPFISAVGSAYVTLFNDYVRNDLKYSPPWSFRLFADIKSWNFNHHAPGAPEALQQSTNVMPDLAYAMKSNPHLKVQVNTGYYDLATPYYQAVYEMRQLPVPAKLLDNIEFKYYTSGHMVYVEPASARALHDNVADFIRRTDNLGGN